MCIIVCKYTLSRCVMGKTLTQKIIERHLIEGNLSVQADVKIKVDQTLTQDSTGTMVYLQLLALEIEKIKTECSVAYIDHNTLQTDSMSRK